MKNKIAVLGHRRIMDIMMSYISSNEATKFVFIQRIEDVSGYQFSDYILLERWRDAYTEPDFILSKVRYRIK